jgi:hypothetical protein
VAAAAICVLAFNSCEDDSTSDSNPVTAIVVSNSGSANTFTLVAGATQQAEVAVTPANADDADQYTRFTYKSSNPTVFTVDENGLITAVGAGSAVLTVTPANNADIRATCMVVVYNPDQKVTSVAFDESLLDLYIEAGTVLELADKVTVLPADALLSDVEFTSSNEAVATVNEYGRVWIHTLGDATITARAIDGSNVEGTMNIHARVMANIPFDRTDWTVTTSHQHYVESDGTVVGDPALLFDDNTNTCIGLVKPGKTLAGISVPAGDEVFFVVDMKEQKEFNFLQLSHRQNNTYDTIRFKGVSVFGSNDEGDDKTFTTILDNVTVSSGTSVVHVPFVLEQSHTYRFVKVQLTGYTTSSGNTVQMSEFNVGVNGWAPLPAPTPDPTPAP